MTVDLLNSIFYIGGESGASEIVGNDWRDGAVIGRVARYTVVAPNVGAQRISMTLHTTGKHDGSHIPIRFYVGTDPDSHANAGPDSEYSGTLTLGDDWLTFTGEMEILMLPGKTYYLWLFPGSVDYGHYSWQRAGYVSTLDTEGAAFLLSVTVGGAWRKIMLHVVKGGKFFLIAPCVVKGGKWHYFGAPN